MPMFLTGSITECLQRILSGLQDVTSLFESSFPGVLHFPNILLGPAHAPDTAVKLEGATALQVHLAAHENLSLLLSSFIPAVQ